MKLLITGLSHHTAPVEVRARLAFEENTLLEALDRLRRRPGMIEGMILSTCNRVEVAVTAEDERRKLTTWTLGAIKTRNLALEGYCQTEGCGISMCSMSTG